MIGSHCLETWSKTQAAIAKRAAEIGLFSVVRGACEGLGLQTLYADLGTAGLEIRLHMGSSAAKGIIQRKGVANVRHLQADVVAAGTGGPEEVGGIQGGRQRLPSRFDGKGSQC